MLWATSPACTELETLVLDWLVEMLALPATFLSTGKGGGVIQDTASSAALCALLAGRERATNYSSNENGVDGTKLVAYTSAHAHSSIEKAAKIAGIGRKNLRLIDVDSNFAMRPDALQKQITADIAAGLKPCFICATVGTTSSNAVDSLEAIGKIASKHGIWLHVDGAMAGTAALCPEFRSMQKGLELADSYCFNPHKWMLTNFDCTCFYVADRAALIETLSVTPEYLRNAASATGAVFDYRDWQIPLGRRFRALKLWFVIRHYGVEGLQAHIRRHVELAQRFLSWLKADDRFEVMAPAPLNLVCFRLRPEHGANADATADAANEALMHRLNRSGKIYLTHTKLNGKFTLRMSIGQSHTEERHIEAAWALIQKEAEG
jgi:aromatic-L-amino-acid decarboxylase